MWVSSWFLRLYSGVLLDSSGFVVMLGTKFEFHLLLRICCLVRSGCGICLSNHSEGIYSTHFYRIILFKHVS